jgi:phosphoglycolate phosphatase
MRTLLFDIDGTLLMTNGGGSGAIKLAIEQEFGLSEARSDVRFSGRTDRSLLVELLQLNRLPSDRAHQERLADRYKRLFPEVLCRRGGRVLPGAVPLLQALSGQRDLRVYVMTGNLQRTATHKLQHFGLLPFFRGIFGGDHDHDRIRLARRTAGTLRRRYGAAALRDLVVIGDTPDDIRCGRAIGAKVVAVCTGHHDRAELEAEKPTSVHDDLSDLTAVCGQLMSAAW